MGLLVVAGPVVSGCAGEDENPDAASWRARLGSDDARERVEAVDAIPGAPGDDALAELEDRAVRDPDARVREHAVLAYGQLAGPEGIGFLRDVARGDEEAAVTSAAMASLERLRAAYPSPPRARVKVDVPETFAPGETFEIRVRCESDADAPRAMLGLRLPEGFARSDRGSLHWRGALAAGSPEEIAFPVVAPRHAVRASARVHLQVDYPDAIDVEVLDERLRLTVDEHGGRFERQGPAGLRPARPEKVR